jgi:hypothetical protein
VSYQREDERYWTDYLRVALPIVGLLLLVGLLWFWLASIIGDDDSNEPTATPNTAVTQIAAATSTATIQGVVDIFTPTVLPAGPTNTPGGEAPTNTPEGAEGQPTEEPADTGGRFQVGETVVTNDPDVRLRSEPSSASDDTIITSLEEGTELTINGESVVGDDDITWWPVIAPDGTEGYVADDFLDPAE